MADRRYKVRVYHGPYSGTEYVFCDENTDTEVIHAKAKAQFMRKFGPSLPMCASGEKIIDWQPAD